jgi:hypothetical protein
MKCDNCPALETEGYESPEAYCAVYPESECVEFKDGSLGCRHKLATINKKLAVRDDYEAHRWDGIGEWYQAEQEKEQAVKEAVRNACELSEVIFAYKGLNDELVRCKMDDEIPSFLQDFVFRFQQALEYQGYDIVKRESEEKQ